VSGKLGPSRVVFMAPWDIGLFLRSARTDAEIARVKAKDGARAAFEAAYTNSADPWASADPKYYYQRWKYAGILDRVPRDRVFRRALDIGSGLGTLSLGLAGIAQNVLGLDIAQAAVDRATLLAGGRNGVRFAQGDVCALDKALDGGFDLVVIADTLYYLDQVDDLSLKRVAGRIARLLAPGGVCVLANHYFFPGDADSRLTRRIHQAFAWSPDFALISEHWRPFYWVSLLRSVGPGISAE
jgi:SAM-dependent methyltransferase